MTPPPAETSLLGLPLAGVPAVSPVFGAAAPFRPAATWRRALVFAGPGCLIAVGYMDPGNWATDLAAGSRFGYALLPAILVSSLVAMFLQHLSLKLGVATGRDLAQHCRAALRPRTALALWLAAEVGIVACDLAEVLGTAVALKLLFGLPLLAGVAATALDSLILLGLLRVGCRRLEAFVLALILVVGACFAAQLALARPGLRDIALSLAPTPALVTDPAKLYLALGIFGATVMPHNLYLHSALAGSRAARASPAARREAVRFSSLDSGAALTLALLVNAAILILAAAAFHARGHPEVAGLEDAHRLLSPLLGTSAAGLLFALALLASGQNSTLTGTLAGQVVMEGMTGLRLDPRLRRLVTRGLAIAPALVVIGLAGEGSVTPLLIGSQVVLSLQLGFAVIPLVSFTSDRGVMGDLANGKAVRRIGWAIGSAIVAVNGWLVSQTMLGGL